MVKMFQNVRRLAYSYDFDDCSDSLTACADDDDCEDDEECDLSRRRRTKRALRQRDEDTTMKSRSLLFGMNSMGECVCA